MGRLGVSFIEVARVAKGLQEKGRNPTVDAVREVLRTGSRSTIGPYLKQWRIGQVQKFEDNEPQNNTNAHHNIIGHPEALLGFFRHLELNIEEQLNLKLENLTQKIENHFVASKSSHVRSNVDSDDDKESLSKVKDDMIAELNKEYKNLSEKYHLLNVNYLKTRQLLEEILMEVKNLCLNS